MLKILNNCCCPNTQPDTHEIQTINRTIRKYKLHLNLLTINAETKNEQFLNDILNKVQLNSYQSILENERFTQLKKDNNFQSKIKEIEDHLIKNIQKWNKHPNEFIHCLIANHTYCFTKQDYTEIIRAKKNNERLTEISGFSFKTKQKNKKQNELDELIEQDDKQCDKVWQELLENNWIIYEIVKLNGYKSIIYINEHSKHVVLAYQGIKFNLTDYFSTKEEKYLKSTTKLVQNQYIALYSHVKKCFQLITKDLKNYSLSFTGYSFGSVLADISVYISQACFKLKDVKSVTFESVGSSQYLEHLNKTIDLNDLDLNTYLLNEPNLVNTSNKHIGKQFFLKSNETSSNDFILKILKNHMKNQLHSFHVNGFKSLCSLNLIEMLECLRNKTEIQEIIAWPIIIVPPKTIDYKLKETEQLTSTINPIPDEYPVKVLATFNLNTLFQIFQLINKIDLNNSIYSIKTETDVANRTIGSEETLDKTVKEIDLYKRAFQPGEFNNDLYLNLIKSIDYVTTEKSLSDKFTYKLLLDLNDKFTIQNGYIETASREIEITQIDTLFERIESLFPSLKHTIQSLIDFNEHYIRDINRKFSDYEPQITDPNLSFLKTEMNSQKVFDNDFKQSQYKTITGDYKSLLAFKYAKSMLKNNTCLIWIDANESREQTLNNFGFFADHLIAKNLPRNNELISFLKETLNIKFIKSSFVIILNNVADIDFIKDFSVGFNSNVQFVITTDHEIEYKGFLNLHFHTLSHSLIAFKTINHKAEFKAHLTNINEKHVENFFNDITLSQSRVNHLVKMLKIFKNWDFKQMRRYCESIFDLLERECDFFYEYSICLAFLEPKFLSFELLEKIFDFLNRKNLKPVKFMHCLKYLTDLSILVKDVYFMINDEFAEDFYTLTNVEYEQATEKVNVILLALLHLTPDNKTYLHLKEDLSSQFPILIKQFDHLKKYHIFNQKTYSEFLKLEIKVNNIKNNILENIYHIEFQLQFEQNRSDKIKLRTNSFTNDKKEMIFKLNFLEKLLNKDLDKILDDLYEMKTISQLFCEEEIKEFKIQHELDINNDDETTLYPEIISYKRDNEIIISEIDRFQKDFEFKFDKKQVYLREVKNLKELIIYLSEQWNSNENFPLVLKYSMKNHLKISNAKQLMNELYVEHFKPLFKDSYKFIINEILNKIAPCNGYAFFDVIKHLSGVLTQDVYSNMDSILFFECEKVNTGLYVVLLNHINNNKNTTRNYIIVIDSRCSVQFCRNINGEFIESMKVVDNNLLIEFSDQYCNFQINEKDSPKLTKIFKRKNLILKGVTQKYMFFLDLKNELKIKSFAQVERFQFDEHLDQIIKLVITEHEGYNIDQIEVVGDYKPGEAYDCICYVKASREFRTVILAYNLEDSFLITKLENDHLILRNFKFNSKKNIIIYDEIKKKIQIFNPNLDLLKETEILDGYGCFKNFFIGFDDLINFYEYI